MEWKILLGLVPLLILAGLCTWRVKRLREEKRELDDLRKWAQGHDPSLIGLKESNCADPWFMMRGFTIKEQLFIQDCEFMFGERQGLDEKAVAYLARLHDTYEGTGSQLTRKNQ